MGHMKHCEGIVGTTPTEWGFQSVQCGQVVGLTAFRDSMGDLRYACVRHLERVQRRYGTLDRADVEHEATHGAEEDPPVADWRAWSEAELREAFGR